MRSSERRCAFFIREVTEMSKEFGERLRELRKSNTEYSQEDMAKLIGVKRSTYTYYETGKSEPGFENLRKIVSILKVDYNTMLDYKE